MNRYSLATLFTGFLFITQIFAQDVNSVNLKYTYLKPNESLGLISSKLNESSRDTFNSDFKFQFSLGGGVRFYNNFNQAEAIINADIGFRTSKHFILINGVEFSIHKYTSYDEEEFGVEKTRIYTSLIIAPSLFLQTKYFMFYAGGGAGWTFPSNVGSAHIFLLTRVGYKMGESTSINLSVRLPWYLEGEVEGLSASAMYCFVF